MTVGNIGFYVGHADCWLGESSRVANVFFILGDARPCYRNDDLYPAGQFPAPVNHSRLTACQAACDPDPRRSGFAPENVASSCLISD